MQAGALDLKAAPGTEVIGSAPRIPAVRPGDSFPQAQPGRIDPMAYDGDEGGLAYTGGNLGPTGAVHPDNIFAVHPSDNGAGGHFSESDYNDVVADNGGDIGTVGSNGSALYGNPDAG